MCEQSLFNMAPEATKKVIKFNSEWGSLFDYMDMSVNKPLLVLACTIPMRYDKDNSLNPDQANLSSFHRNQMRINSKYGRVYKAVGVLPKINNNSSIRERNSSDNEFPTNLR